VTTELRLERVLRTTGKEPQYPLYRGLGGPWILSGTVREISLLSADNLFMLITILAIYGYWSLFYLKKAYNLSLLV